MEGKRVETSKLAGDSGSKRSTFMVRQFTVAMIIKKEEREVGRRNSGPQDWVAENEIKL